MKRVLLAGSMNPNNKGDQARIKATVRSMAGDDDVTLSLLSHFKDDKKIYLEDRIEIVEAPWACESINLTRMVPAAISTLIKYALLALIRQGYDKELFKYDAVVIASGIDFSDYAGRLPLYYACFLITLFKLVMNKPVMCYSQSMGPIRHRVLRHLVRFFLNKTSMISVRDVFSIDFLNGLHVNQPDIYYTVDPAFMLTSEYLSGDIPRITHGLNNGRNPLIGFSLSPAPFIGPGNDFYQMGLWYKTDKKKIKQLSDEYIQKMAYLCNRLIDMYGANLLFIPSCMSNGDDDRECMRKVNDRIVIKDKVICISESYTLAEHMRIIGSCDLFIGTRLHASIMAAIMGVPLVPLVGNNGPRIPGIMKSLGMDSYIRNIMFSDEEQLLQDVITVWDTRKQLKRMIVSRSKMLQEMAMENVMILNEFCSRKTK